MIFNYDVIKQINTKQRYNEWKEMVINRAFVNFFWAWFIGALMGAAVIWVTLL